PRLYLVHRGGWTCCRFPAVRGQVRSHITAVRGPAKRRSVRCRATRFCPQGVGADLSAKGCEAAPKQAASVVSGASRRMVLLPVPGSSRASEASPGPLLEKPSALPDIH
ncbi:hypothetical protein CU666_20915, partial [Pseudomonas syringae pv. actinidifoliorum]|nr:hypothetical protein [Pseudomonas syringae pv. actinidifoliorum]